MKKIVISLIVSAMMFSSCQSRREVAQVWEYIQERPDSALSVLNAMDASSFHGRTLAEYRLLKAMALDKNYVNVASDSLALPAYQYFRKHGPKEKEMMSLYYLALSHYYSHDDTEAILLLEGVTEMANQVGNLYYVGLSQIMESYAYLRTYCISEAVESAEHGVNAFAAIPNPFQVQRAKLQLADAYHTTMKFKQAIDIWQELINTCPADTFTMRRALIHAAYSLYLYHPERADSAMRFYDRALTDYRASMSSVEAAHYGEVAAMAGNTQLAHQIVDQLKLSGKHPEQRAYLEYKLYKKENKLEDALAAAEEFHDQLDTIMTNALEQSLVKAQRDYQEQQKLATKHALIMSNRVGLVSVLCLLLALLALWLFYSRRRKISALEREQMIGNLRSMATLLQESERKNSDLEENLLAVQMRYIAAYKKQFSKISSIIENYYTSSGMKNGRDMVYKQVMDIAATIGSDNARMKSLERDLDSIHGHAMELYRSEFPDKEEDHYRWVCLFMAGFTTPMLELLTKAPRNTIYSKKKRLLEEIKRSSALHKELFQMVIK